MPASFDFHTIEAMLRSFAVLVTSEVAGHEIEMALDNNGDTYWKPTGTGDQVVLIDLGFGGSIISNVGDSNFNNAGNWANNTLATFDKAGNLTITSSASGQYCTLATGGFDTVFKEGQTYRIIYDYVERATGFEFRTDGEVIGTLVAGTDQSIDWTSGSGQDELRVQSLTSSADGDVDNVHIILLDDRLTINSWAVVFRNYLTDHRGSTVPRLNLLFSHNGIDFTNWNINTLNDWGWTVGDLMILGSNFSDRQYRYIVFSWISMETTVEISHYFLTRKATVAQGNEFPEDDSVEYVTKVQNVPGGLTMKRQVNSVAVLTKPRTWNFTTLADKDVLESIFTRSHGSGQPLIMKEDSDDPLVVRIVAADFSRSQNRHHIFGPRITFQTVPHVDPSKGF